MGNKWTDTLFKHENEYLGEERLKTSGPLSGGVYRIFILRHQHIGLGHKTFTKRSQDVYEMSLNSTNALSYSDFRYTVHVEASLFARNGPDNH